MDLDLLPQWRQPEQPFRPRRAFLQSMNYAFPVLLPLLSEAG